MCYIRHNKSLPFCLPFLHKHLLKQISWHDEVLLGTLCHMDALHKNPWGMLSGPFNPAAVFKARDAQMKTLNFKEILQMCDGVD